MAFPSLSIGDLTAKMPIVQGGMGVGISLSGLASAVANQGGIGVIAGAMIGMKEPDVAKNPIEANLRALRQELSKAREKTQGIIGVNIMVALTTFSQMVRTAIENRADIIFSGAGLPLEMPKHLLQACEEKKEEFKTKLVPIVSSARAATLIARKWLSRFDYLPDAFVVEGPKAGGHLGFKREEIDDPNFALEVLVPQVVEAAKRLEDQKGRAVPVKSPVGMPGRALQNDFIESARQGNKKPFKCVFHCVHTCDQEKTPYCIAQALISAMKGNLERGFAFCGANVARVNSIVSVKELMDSLQQEFDQTISKGRQTLQGLLK